jgi:hypothetical protein
LAREYEVQVWATDSGTSATENFQRATALKSETRVFPLHVDAHSRKPLTGRVIAA